MANGWSITTESVKNSAERVRDLVAQYETEYEKLYAEVENLRGSKWKGTASDAFNSKLEAYKQNIMKMLRKRSENQQVHWDSRGRKKHGND